jgi:hypothetical protein
MLPSQPSSKLNESGGPLTIGVSFMSWGLLSEQICEAGPGSAKAGVLTARLAPVNRGNDDRHNNALRA